MEKLLCVLDKYMIRGHRTVLAKTVIVHPTVLFVSITNKTIENLQKFISKYK